VGLTAWRETLLDASDRFSEHLDGDGATIFAHACKLGLEGIVSKRRHLPYRSGRGKSCQEPGQPGCAAYRRRDVVKRMSAMEEFILLAGAGFDPNLT
jgi:hypothetical protein